VDARQENNLLLQTQKIKTPAISLSAISFRLKSSDRSKDKINEKREAEKQPQIFSYYIPDFRVQKSFSSHAITNPRETRKSSLPQRKSPLEILLEQQKWVIRQQLKKLGQEKITENDVLFILKMDQIRRRVFDEIVAQRKTFSRINTLGKIRRILDQCWWDFEDARHILSFAKRVNQERLCLDDMKSQCEHVWNTWKIMQANEGEKADLDNDDLYQEALEERTLIYQYISKKEEKNSFWKSEFLAYHFFYVLRELADVLKIESLGEIRFRKDEDLSISTALKIKEFQEQEENDRQQLSETFYRRRWKLWDKAHYERPYPDLDLASDERIAEQTIWKIADHYARFDPLLSLNYGGLTYNDFFAVIFDQNFLPVSESNFEKLRWEALSLVEEKDFDLIANPIAATNYQSEINDAFNRIIEHDRAYAEDHWKERVWAIFTKVPAMIIDTAIHRPGTDQHNSVLWNTTLKSTRKRMLQHILGAIQDCNTGITQKLRLLEEAYQEILTNDFLRPQISFFEPVARIIRAVKMQRIHELGKNPFPNTYEENITAPHVAMQRMRLPLSLMGNYEDIVGGWLGNPHNRQNSPEQIIRNLFLSGQPNREYTQWAYDYMSNSYYPLNTFRIPVAAHLTVKSLVDMVYEEFDKSITWSHLNSLVNGELMLRKDRLIPLTLFDNGIFIKTSPPGKPTAKGDFSKNMAFYLLEKMNYVTIQPHIKNKVFQYDEKMYAPGSVFFQGRNRTLEELIELF
jgi:hypothetical protein